MIIKFDETFLPYTDNRTEIEINKRNLGDALEELFCQLPQLYIFMVDNKGEESKKTSLSLNNENVWKAEETVREVSSSDILIFGRDVPEGSGAVGKMIVGALLIVAAIATAVFFPGSPVALFFGKTGLMMIGAMGASLVMSGVAEAIIGTPGIPGMDGNGGGHESSTYTFSGIRNTTASGTPINIVYGTHRVGGHVLNVYTEVIGADTYLYIQQEPERPSRIEETAYHEAGHAVVAAMLFPGSVSRVFVWQDGNRKHINESYAGEDFSNKIVNGGTIINATGQLYEQGLIRHAGMFAQAGFLSRRGIVPGPEVIQGAAHDLDAFRRSVQHVPARVLSVAMVDIQTTLSGWFNGELWPYVEGLATELVRCGELSGDALTALLPVPNAAGDCVI